jgi:two-component sensor histidine kinase
MTQRVEIGVRTPVDLNMAALIEGCDWRATPLGPAKDWPQSLKTIVDVIVNSPLPMIVLWGPELIQIYNAGYAHICHTKHPKALGQATQDCWPEVWDFNAPIYDAVRNGEVRAFERQLLTTNRSGNAEDAWFDLTYSPVRNEFGEVAGVLVTVVESTQHVLLARAVEATVKDGERLRALFELAPSFMALLSGPDHVFDFANRSYRKLVGERTLVGRSVREVLPEVEGQGFFDLLDDVYRSGLPHVGIATPLQVTNPRGTEPTRLYVDFLYQPIVGENGIVSGVFVEGADVTARVLAEDRHKLLTAELIHRVKNALATVLGLARLTRAAATSVDDFLDTLTERVVAMGKTQDLLSEGIWEPVKVVDVLNVELAPYIDNSGRVELHCQDMTMTGAMAINLSLVVHELLTNALKYGALSALGGRLVVTCSSSVAGATLVWSEQTDGLVLPRQAAGFGTSLIERLARSLGGGAKLNLESTGLQATIEFSVLPSH